MPRQYSQEFRQRALRLLDTKLETSEVSEFEEIKSVASKLGISEESVRRWRRKAQIDAGERPGLTSQEHSEIWRLTRENLELRRANEVLKAASAFLQRSSTAPRRHDRLHRHLPRSVRGRAYLPCAAGSNRQFSHLSGLSGGQRHARPRIGRSAMSNLSPTCAPCISSTFRSTGSTRCTRR